MIPAEFGNQHEMRQLSSTIDDVYVWVDLPYEPCVCNTTQRWLRMYENLMKGLMHIKLRDELGYTEITDIELQGLYKVLA